MSSREHGADGYKRVLLLTSMVCCINALYCTFSAVRCDDSRTPNPYPTQESPPGSQLEAMAGVVLL